MEFATEAVQWEWFFKGVTYAFGFVLFNLTIRVVKKMRHGDDNPFDQGL